MSDYPDVPPWEPIADWLARLPQEPQEDAKQNERLASSATKQQLRERYELEAKAIAYDISTHGRGSRTERSQRAPETPFLEAARESLREDIAEAVKKYDP